jgi:hypothetical protein
MKAPSDGESMLMSACGVGVDPGAGGAGGVGLVRLAEAVGWVDGVAADGEGDGVAACAAPALHATMPRVSRATTTVPVKSFNRAFLSIASAENLCTVPSIPGADRADVKPPPRE